MNKFMLAAALAAFLAASCGPALAEESGSAPAPAPAPAAVKECPKPPGTPMTPLLLDVKRINFFLEVPTRLSNALSCHGKEDVCANKYSDREDMKRRLIKDFKSYPADLYPERISSLFVENIDRNFLPFVLHGHACDALKVNILDKSTLYREVNQPDNLTITVKISLDREHDLSDGFGVAALTVYMFRPDLGKSNYSTQVSLSRTMIFDLKGDDIGERLKYFVEHSHLGKVPVREGWSH